jgi:hypothetical protein
MRMLDHIDVISSRRRREYVVSFRGGHRRRDKRDVPRGGRRVAPLVSTEYLILISRPERPRKTGSVSDREKE